MKTFYTDGTGSQQTLNDSQTEKVVVYDTINDAEADLANLAEGQIIATKDDDFEGNAVPVNEVAVNNMHSVTSNAVYNVTGKVEESTSINDLKCYRVGKVVYLRLYKSLTSGLTLSLGTLPQGYRPLTVVRCTLLKVSNYTTAGIMEITYNGDVTVKSANSQTFNDTYSADICFITRD